MEETVYRSFEPVNTPPERAKLASHEWVLSPVGPY